MLADISAIGQQKRFLATFGTSPSPVSMPGTDFEKIREKWIFINEVWGYCYETSLLGKFKMWAFTWNCKS